jgi:hypothetical protein
MYLDYIREANMPVDKSLKVGDRANEGPHPIVINRDWTMEWGQKINVHARNKNNDDVNALKDGMHGFYVYKISCKCDDVQRSGLESLIKVGRSAAPVKAPKDAKEDGSVMYGGIRERLLSYPINYSMNDTELLMVLLFHYRTQAMNFESTIKGKLKKTKKYKAIGTEWFDAKYETEILAAIAEYREELKKKYVPTPRSTPVPESQTPAAPRASPAPRGSGGAGGSGSNGGSGVVTGTVRASTPQVTAQKLRSGPKSKPAPPQSASLDVKKKYVKNAAQKVHNQAKRDGKTDAYAKEVYRKETDKWNAYYGLN